MSSLQFVFCLHNHQPVGNFDHVFSDATRLAYEPFLDLLEAYPGFRACLHHTGPLLEWLDANRPKYLDRLAALAESGQVEILGGAFYEPILPIIPPEDRVGQIVAMSDWLERRVGVRPRGMWLAERVWEPTLPGSIAAAGIEYTVLDDAHFDAVGVEESDRLGYFLTEDQGRTIAVFPIHGGVRRQIPYVEPPETLALLRDQASPDGLAAVVMADDGEKFGVWPDSNRHCYQDGYMYRLAEQVINNDQWLRMRTFSDVLDETPCAGRVYLPTASYLEMMEWALPPASAVRYRRSIEDMERNGQIDEVRQFMRAGFWRSFLNRYDEANHIHKKMLRASRKLASLPPGVRATDAYATAVDHLWRGQCNCAYWHGVFGGLYLTNLRTALYENLIAADRMADAMLHDGAKKWIDLGAEDFDADGEPEVLLDTPGQSLVFKPSHGGMLVEHDVRALDFNILDTLARRREAYHEELLSGGARVRERQLERLLVFDTLRRGSLVDHFLDAGAAPSDMQAQRHAELGDFAGEPYACTFQAPADGSKPARITLSRDGIVQTPGGPIPVTVEKQVEVPATGAGMTVSYAVRNIGRARAALRFAPEFNVNLLAGDAPDRYHEIPRVDLGDQNKMTSVGAVPKVSSFAVVDGWKGLRVQWSLSRPATHWRFPIETAANSVDGVERIYQGTTILPVWDLEIDGGSEAKLVIEYIAEAL